MVGVGSVKLEFYEEFICDNLEFNPFENFVIKMTEKRNKYKKEKKELLQTLTKKKTNAVYRFCIRAKINESYECVSTQWMRTEYDDQVKDWFPLNKGNFMVKLQNHDEIDDNGYSRKNQQSTMSFRFFHNISLKTVIERCYIRNRLFFKNIKIYYSDTDFIYKHNNDLIGQKF